MNVVDVLMKPFDAKALVSLVEKALADRTHGSL